MMSTPIVSRMFYKKYFKLYCPLKLSINFVSNSQKLFAKKSFSIKNRFTFRNDLYNQADCVFSDQRTPSPHLPSGTNCNNLEYEDFYDPDHGFISADLLSEESQPKQRHIKRPLQAKKNNKPSLTYQGEILFGVHPVYLALMQKKRTFHHLYIRKDIDSSHDITLKAEIIKLAKSMGIPVSYVDTRGLKILAPGAVHQGVCLDAGFLPLPVWNENQPVNETAGKNPLWLVLDEILDPMNVGAIIRSAFYFGVTKLFTIRGNSCKLSPTVSKASSGSLEVADIYQIDSLEDFIRKRKDCGWSIVSTLAYSENKLELNVSPISTVEFSTSKPTILILGNEGRGISKAVLKLCDSLISIEPGQTLPEGIDSLNVSVAAGVLLYVLNSQTKNIRR